MLMQRCGIRITAFARARRRFLVALIAACALIAVAGPGMAQPNQIALTAKQIEAFLAANKGMMALIEKLEAAGDKPNPKLMAALDNLARKHGFKDFSEFEDVSESISVVLGGIDPQTKKFTQPPEMIKKEIAQVQADKSLSAAERKELLQELNEQLKTAQNVQHPGNVDLVLKYYDKLEAELQQ
jgi:hypothetical protein